MRLTPNKDHILLSQWTSNARRTGLTLLTSAIIFSLWLPFASANNPIAQKYLVSFKATKSTCLLRINDLPGMNNTRSRSATLSGGYNTTAFVENGSNKIELLMGPEDHDDPKTLYADSSCEVVISKETKDAGEEVARYRLTVDEQGRITARESDGGTLTEGYTKNENDYDLYKLAGHFSLYGLPEWRWVNANPVSEQDMEKIKQAYEAIWTMMQNRDIDGLKALTKAAHQETAYAEGISPGMMFLYSGLPERVIDPRLTPVPIQWNRYRLMTYSDGRLFRMGVGFIQNSPLKFQDAEGNVVFTWNPYFAIIDGNVVLVRG